MALIRFGISPEKGVLVALDNYTKDNKIKNRSQAINHLISNNLLERKWQCNSIIADSIASVYDHHKYDLLNNLILIQHVFHPEISSS